VLRRKEAEDRVGKLITRVQKVTVMALAVMLIVVMLLSTLHLGVLIGQEILKPPKWLIAV
jgi:hypothetical protein